jgi:hypothetical protein
LAPFDPAQQNAARKVHGECGGRPMRFVDASSSKERSYAQRLTLFRELSFRKPPGVLCELPQRDREVAARVRSMGTLK